MLAPKGPVSRRREIIGGILIAAGGLYINTLIWRNAAETGSFLMLASFMAPVFTVIGVALVLFPGYRTERARRGEDISQLRGAQLLTRRWKVVTVIAFLAGAVNFSRLALGW